MNFVYFVTSKKADRFGNPKDTITVYSVKNNVLTLLQRDVEFGYLTPNEAACNIIAESVPRLQRFPKNFAVPQGATLNEDRTKLKYKSGTVNYPRYLAREKKITIFDL